MTSRRFPVTTAHFKERTMSCSLCFVPDLANLVKVNLSLILVWILVKLTLQFH